MGKQSHSGVGLGREGAPLQAQHSGREWGGRLDSGAPVGFCWMGNHWIWVDLVGSCLVWAVLAGDRRVGGSSLVDLIGLVVGRVVALALHLIGLVVGALNIAKAMMTVLFCQSCCDSNTYCQSNHGHNQSKYVNHLPHFY